MKVVQEEIFGPVIVALPFDDEDEGIAHRERHRLRRCTTTCSAPTPNRAFRASKRLRAGNVGINTTQRNHNAPFGGTKYSGVGRDGGVFGLHAYSELQSVVWPGVTTCPPSRSFPTASLAYGMQLPVQALSVRVSMPWEHEHGTVDDMVRVAQACDDAGFLYVAVCHHVAIPREPAEMMSTQWFDPIATLGYLAAHTDAHAADDQRVRRARTSTRSQTAKAFATLDALSGGRVIVGVGAGHVEGEFDALGVSFAERGAITDEAIDAILAALSDEWRRTRPTLEVGRRRPAAAPGAAAAPADLDRRLGQARAAARRARRRRLDPAGDAARPARRRHRVHPARARQGAARARCPRSATTSSRTSASPTGTLPEGRAARLTDRIVDFAINAARRASACRTCRCGSLARSARRAVRPDRARSAPRSVRTSPASP